mgnify:FL=1|tara:strand:- start:6321 stop:6512 length:192 start_codon:yes stop_codon:yes gene_type:complete
MYDKLKQFIATVNRSNMRKDTSIRLSIEEANEIQSDITKLLLELKERETSGGTITIDGGEFRQ